MSIEATDLTKEQEALRKELEQARIDKARLEGEAAALRETRATLETPQGFGKSEAEIEAEWQRLEEKTGQKREALMASAEITRQILAKETEGLKKELEEAKKRAENAEKEIGRFKTDGTRDKTMKEFFKDNPAYSAYEKEIGDFLADYSEDIKSDPDKMKRLLDKAKTYVKGHVGDAMSKENGSQSSFRIGGGSPLDSKTEEFVDVSDIENEAQRAFVRGIANDISKRGEDGKKILEKFGKKDGTGVSVWSDDEFSKVEKNPMGR